MKLFNIRGKLVDKNVSKYAIDWNKKSRSKIQFDVKQFLKPYWSSYLVFEEFPVFGSLLKVDILNMTLKIAIEVHGPQHNEFHYFHNNSPNAYLKSIKNDSQKLEWLSDNKFKIVEINHDEVKLLTPEFCKEKYNLIL